ncbi:leukocyte tyrosine kinase receptor [Galendromus occidentalis]|uniref:Tyrosine-protein kinase receptor n=1 Tax=Galendromus occidentalis TaxID=34638 RepID=A0AAJ7SHB2_9ACAR|nr:leukocyte tyrosine kinase receptor [Galendromus occidentalis]
MTPMMRQSRRRSIWIFVILCFSHGIHGIPWNCDFESPCAWQIENGFVLNARENATFFTEANSSPPEVDGSRRSEGHFAWTQGPNFKLHLANLAPVRSDRCTLLLDVYRSNYSNAMLSVFLSDWQHTKEMYSLSTEVIPNGNWHSAKVFLGLLDEPFNLTIEIHPSIQRPIPNTSKAAAQTSFRRVPRKAEKLRGAYIAFDNILLKKCFKEPVQNCGPREYRCNGTSGNTTICVDESKLCDFEANCPQGDDETLPRCKNIPANARCNFDDDTLCKWAVSTDGSGFELRPLPHENSSFTYDHTTGTAAGRFICSRKRSGTDPLQPITLTSPLFPRLPYYHSNNESAWYQSCHFRFFFYKPKRVNAANVFFDVRENDPRYADGREIAIWPRKNDRDMSNDRWVAVQAPLPTMLRYDFRVNLYVHYFRITSDVCIGIDDISLSPACFGLGVPANETREYPAHLLQNPDSERILPGNITMKYEFDSCGMSGKHGPTDEQCRKRYQSPLSKLVRVTKQGTQIWQVPETAVYTIFAVGASGGFGLRNTGRTEGAYVRATFRFTKGQKIHILVGQKGSAPCDTPVRKSKDICVRNSGKQRRYADKFQKLQRGIRDERLLPGGGGGGATFVFREDAASEPNGKPNFTPLLIAAGGGGLAAEKTDQNPGDTVGDIFYENGVFDASGTSLADTRNGAGAGGGWSSEYRTSPTVDGQSLLSGANGGDPCKNVEPWKTYGGFGGGGGGCSGGGGGGGWKGGDAVASKMLQNGAGGTSFILKKETLDRPSVFSGLQQPAYLKHFKSRVKGDDVGHGFVIVVSSKNILCPCKEICIPVSLATRAPTNEDPSLNPTFRCACEKPTKVVSRHDNITCVDPAYDQSITELRLSSRHFLMLVISTVVVLVIAAFFLFVGISRCRFNKITEADGQPFGRREHSSAELQLSRLRQQTGMITEYNPNYEFGATACGLHDLREIPREHLKLVKALGQGAFGEVYQGTLSYFNGEPREFSVAVKTLPELSTADSEKDFITEACIMSKFSHPNIVSFLGVCFDRMPRFIVLELLAGGDLKSFLREVRPLPNRPSDLKMGDLLLLAVDVAKGCQYLEEKRFIHRDIAARNCLLTSTLPSERKVKIADFGMARDIYRADYYRKGGKAMLPVKWMPPEAFLDGLFTSKTDVWSFGVLLWEVMSMGYMPYPGRGNQEVMQMVTGGSRLEPPDKCPGPVYHLMTQCWHSDPEERPCFSVIIERLGYCLQDPDVTSVELPLTSNAPSMDYEGAAIIFSALRQSKEHVFNESAPLLSSPSTVEATPTSPLDDYMIPMGQYVGNDPKKRINYPMVPVSPSVAEASYPLQLLPADQISPTFPAPPPPRQVEDRRRHGAQRSDEATYRPTAMDEAELPILEPLMQSQNQQKKKTYSNVCLDRSRLSASGSKPDSFGEISC